MKKQDSGQDQLQRICDLLRRDTLEPALSEARRIESEAEQHAQKILEEAHKKASEREAHMRDHLKQEQERFEHNIQNALQQALNLLRQEIEEGLFNPSLAAILTDASQDSKWVAHLLNAMVQAVVREGTQTSFEAVLGAEVNAEDVKAHLAAPARELLQKGISVGHFSGGVQLRLVDRNLTLDVSDEALRELFGRFLRKDFRSLLFG